jgi:hypothetical protein
MSLRTLTLSVLLVSAMSTSGCSKDPVVAVVGSYKITRRQAEFRNKVIRHQYPNETRNLGLDQLIKAYTDAEIMKMNGRPITQETVEREEKRIDQQTLMPEKLAEVKDIFGKDRDAYLSVYVLPTFAERVIFYEFFESTPQFHEHSRQIASTVLSEAKKLNGFEAVAKRFGTPLRKFKVAEKKGLVFDDDPRLNGDDEERPGISDQSPANFQKQMILAKMKEREKEEEAKRPPNQEAMKWINEIIKPLKPGMFHPEVLNHNGRWFVVRLVKVVKPGKEYEMEGLFLPREDFGKWYETQRAKIKFARYD